MIVIP